MHHDHEAAGQEICELRYPKSAERIATVLLVGIPTFISLIAVTGAVYSIVVGWDGEPLPAGRSLVLALVTAAAVICFNGGMYVFYRSIMRYTYSLHLTVSQDGINYDDRQQRRFIRREDINTIRSERIESKYGPVGWQCIIETVHGPYGPLSFSLEDPVSKRKLNDVLTTYFPDKVADDF